MTFAVCSGDIPKAWQDCHCPAGIALTAPWKGVLNKPHYLMLMSPWRKNQGVDNNSHNRGYSFNEGIVLVHNRLRKIVPTKVNAGKQCNIDFYDR